MENIDKMIIKIDEMHFCKFILNKYLQNIFQNLGLAKLFKINSLFL